MATSVNNRLAGPNSIEYHAVSSRFIDTHYAAPRMHSVAFPVHHFPLRDPSRSIQCGQKLYATLINRFREDDDKIFRGSARNAMICFLEIGGGR
jgi:hypothetical protein